MVLWEWVSPIKGILWRFYHHNRMELLVIVGLKIKNQYKVLVLILNMWWFSWKKWFEKKGFVDRKIQIYGNVLLFRKHKVDFKWIKGHNHVQNERWRITRYGCKSLLLMHFMKKKQISCGWDKVLQNLQTLHLLNLILINYLCTLIQLINE
jgi:ribonuclease HI